MTEAEATFRELSANLTNRRVTSTRMFLSTLQIYFDTENAGTIAIWFEPSWHLRTPEGVATGSGAIYPPSDFGDEEELRMADETLQRAADAAEVLVGRSLEQLDIDPATYVMAARFSGEVTVATFLDDPGTTAQWVVHDMARDVAVRGTAKGIMPGSRESAIQ